MKLLYVTIVLFLGLNLVYGQNLVINPSFENYSSCPQGPSELSKVNNWKDPFINLVGDTCSTSDFYHSCFNLPIPLPGGNGVDVPSNILGYQFARTGNGYTGIILDEKVGLGCNGAFGSGWREYIEGELSTPLSAGLTYCVKFYVSIPNNVAYSSSSIGVYFSNNLVNVNCNTIGSASHLPLTPQLSYSGAPITDTSNWVLMQWNYTATGGEKYITIGNFNPNSSTNTVCVNANATNPYAYFYIDDVSVEPTPCCLKGVTPIGPLCLNDAPVQIQTETSGGNWIGNGVSASGIFNPSLAGVGTHAITYDLACGDSTINVVVSPCQNLSVCKESNGSFTVSNGVPNFTWANWQNTNIQSNDCVACGGTLLPIIGCQGATIPCTIASTGYVNFATGTNVTIPASYTQVQITDGSGTTLVINPSTVPNCNSTPCPTITLSSSNVNNVSCFGGSNGSATVNASGGTSPYTYTWTPGNLNGATQSTLTAQTYTVTATDNAGCTGSTTIAITQPTALNVVTSSTNAACGTANGSVTATTSGGTSPYVFAWTPNIGNTSTVNNVASGSYSVTVTDNKGCTQTQSVTVNSTNGPTVTLNTSSNPTCFGGTNGSASVNVNGGNAPYTYLWSPSGGSSATASNLIAGAYTCTVTDNSGCVSSLNVNLTQPTAINTQASITNETCGNGNGQIQLNTNGGTGAYTYSWQPNAGNGASVTNLSAGNYIVTITDAQNCTLIDTFTVNNQASFTVNILTNNVTCAGQNNGSSSITTNGGQNPFTYSWNPGNLTGSTQNNLGIGNYTVTITDNLGCSLDTNITISAPNSMQLVVNKTDSYCGTPGSIAVQTTGGSQPYVYSVNGQITNPNTLTNLSQGTYFIEVTDANNCTDDSTVTILELEDLETIKVPNVITPNNDGINDLWEIQFTCIETLEVTIVNRWGNVVASYNGLSSAWDGKSKSIDCADGVYFYKLKVTYVSGKKEDLQGFITIIR